VNGLGPLTEISLFTGAGGGVWASKLLGHRIVCYVENEPYCQKVIKARIEDGIWDDAPIWDDIQTFDGRDWFGRVDLVSAGFPCQPWSVAGRRRGEEDPRNLWPDTILAIRNIRPTFAFLENVPALLSSGYIGVVLGDLAQAGYDARWIVLGADDVGAPHRRKRIWILAHPSAGGLYRGRASAGREEGRKSDLAHSESAELENSNRSRRHRRTPQRKEAPAGCDGDAPGSGELADPDSPRCGERQGSEPSGPAHDPAESRGEASWWDIDPADLPNTDSGRLAWKGLNAAENKDTSSGKDSSGCDRTAHLSDSDFPAGLRRIWSQRYRRGNSTSRREDQDNVGDPEGRTIGTGLCETEPRRLGRGRSGDSGSFDDHRGSSCARDEDGWPTLPHVGRVAHGVAHRCDRLRALGNGWVPLVAVEAWFLLTEGLL
jgi:site-specific DNA-cytosine methylase